MNPQLLQMILPQLLQGMFAQQQPQQPQLPGQAISQGGGPQPLQAQPTQQAPQQQGLAPSAGQIAGAGASAATGVGIPAAVLQLILPQLLQGLFGQEQQQPQQPGQVLPPPQRGR